MTRQRRTQVLVLTLALGLGVWGAAFTFTPAAFVDGQVLGAAELNDLLNDNLQAASDAIDAKFDRAGGILDGAVAVEGPSVSVGEGASLATLRARTTDGEGFAGLFENFEEGSSSPVVGIKNAGSGAALTAIASGGGPLFLGSESVLSTSIRIDADGSVRLGAVSGSAANLVLDAATGTIRNSVGSGLPIAYGVVFGGNRQADASTDNWTVTYNAGTENYVISIDGVNYVFNEFTTVVTPIGGGARIPRTGSVGGDLLVFLYDLAGNETPGSFSFVTFGPGQ